ncbi:MAG: DNA polymerase III subunit gamma/tau [Beijerinckiaceae bacterium]|nr:DNA polymerase III subunit gamma/tau [Beijerinckiaceae bacterium]
MNEPREPDQKPAEPDQGGFDLGAASGRKTAAYRVLARKYRPSTFDDLIGQDAMVRTLRNAFDLDRIHQAYILTGVRGVGKTTTARILARAFNYEMPARGDAPAIVRPTIDMLAPGVHCPAIIESRHVDVIEMDAASNTGIDDVREIIESSRYKPVMARYKVFIIDEVHMLSKQAFNGLLKTLEEPPEHVKFLFATTEIEKVPVTVRSRCQRFDLRRIDADLMISHLSSICDREGVKISDKALALIARAAEGSVRDALSLTDQAIAHGSAAGEDAISEAAVRDMLGVADRSRIIDLFESIMRGDVASAVTLMKEQYDQGADPGLVLSDLAEFVHFVTMLKIAPDTRLDASITQDEAERGRQFAGTLNVATLTRAWQILTKGMSELRDSARPLASADMVLVRIAYAADLPSPDEVIRRLSNGGGGETRPPSQPQPQSGGGGGASAMRVQSAPAAQARMPEIQARTVASTAPRVQLARFEDLVALAQANRDIQLKMALERDVRLVRFERGMIEFALASGGSPQLAANLMRRLQEWTGERWMVAISSSDGAPTLRETSDARERERAIGVRADPLVKSVLEQFPGSEIVAVRSLAPETPEPVTAGGPYAGDEVAYIDQVEDDDDL